MKTSIIRQWIDSNREKFPGWETDKKVYSAFLDACCSETGFVRKSIVNTLSRNRTGKTQQTEIAVNPESGCQGISEVDLRQRFDPLFQLREGVQKLKVGTYYTDSEFREVIVKSRHVGYRSRSESPEFEIYRGKAGGVVYWSHPTSIKKLKTEGVLT